MSSPREYAQYHPSQHQNFTRVIVYVGKGTIIDLSKVGGNINAADF